jgi:hypothetical protein
VEQVLPGSRRRKVAQTMYTHVSKCKNDKRKKSQFFLNLRPAVSQSETKALH